MSDWTEFRDTAEAAAVIAGNYYFPGSSLITKHLVSDGAEEKLDSDTGRVLQLGSSGFGASDGNLANYTGGEGAGSPLPSFLGGPQEAVSGLDLGGPGSSPASWMGGGETVDPTAVSGIDLGGPGSSPATMTQPSAEGQMAPNIQQQKQQPQPEPEQQDDSAEKNARRQALMEKAQKLREQIAALRAQAARESAIPQTVLGNPA